MVSEAPNMSEAVFPNLMRWRQDQCPSRLVTIDHLMSRRIVCLCVHLLRRAPMSRPPRRSQQTARKKCALRLEQLEDRRMPAAYRTIDGTGNNLAHPEWGS